MAGSDGAGAVGAVSTPGKWTNLTNWTDSKRMIFHGRSNSRAVHV
jgi:hypothetical protein